MKSVLKENVLKSLHFHDSIDMLMATIDVFVQTHVFS